MDEALKQLGIPSLRPWQARVLENWRSGRDALVLSGTGTGKSLCFQLPPIITGQYWFVRGANRADFRASSCLPLLQVVPPSSSRL